MGKYLRIKNKFNKIKAFTLVELLVVVILSIIAVISIPLMSMLLIMPKKEHLKIVFME